jgi:hypothetical protein
MARTNAFAMGTRVEAEAPNVDRLAGGDNH